MSNLKSDDISNQFIGQRKHYNGTFPVKLSGNTDECSSIFGFDSRSNQLQPIRGVRATGLEPDLIGGSIAAIPIDK